MPQPIFQEKKVEWKDKINQQKSSGKSVSEWCRTNQVHPRVFYYWRAKVFPKIIDRSCFTELTNNPNQKTDIVIECQGVRIYLEKHFDPAALKYCLAMLRGIKC